MPPSLLYRRAAVRDLAWLVLDGALPLPQHPSKLEPVRLQDTELAEFLDLLKRWDDDPHDDWLGPVDPRLRLGLYAERLFGSWLRQSRRIRLLAMNWPLRANRITLGEADFLVQREGPGGTALQLWELACKFYLGVPGSGWLGPELNDSLAAKMGRMGSHQLQLIHHAGFRNAWPGSWSACAWLSGWLLDPAAALLPAAPSPICARSGRPPSVWAQAGEDSVQIAEAHGRGLGVTSWWLLPKRRWLRPVFNDPAVDERFDTLGEAASRHTSPADHREKIDRTLRPMMLAGVRALTAAAIPGSAAGAGAQAGAGPFGTIEAPRAPQAEVMRVMLVPPGWAARAAAWADCRTGRPLRPRLLDLARR